MMTHTPSSLLLQVVEHLVKQGKPATDGVKGCMYRSEEGLKCAIGCLIPDEEYNPKIEWHSVSQLISQNLMPPTLKTIYDSVCTSDVFNVFRLLQNIHDFSWEKKDKWIKSQLEITILEYCDKFDIDEETKNKALELVKGMK